jgi:hypothetical protein
VASVLVLQIQNTYVIKCSGLLDKISHDEWHRDQCRITTIPSVGDVRTEQNIEVPRGHNNGTLIRFVPTPGYSNVKIDYTPQPPGVLL